MLHPTSKSSPKSGIFRSYNILTHARTHARSHIQHRRGSRSNYRTVMNRQLEQSTDKLSDVCVCARAQVRLCPSSTFTFGKYEEHRSEACIFTLNIKRDRGTNLGKKTSPSRRKEIIMFICKSEHT